ncbi:MAG: hypothetical protein P1U74_05565 [Legionellaceae bacterium]|nr:hypothetical protein [Legionellaceae bacterium]
MKKILLFVLYFSCSVVFAYATAEPASNSKVKSNPEDIFKYKWYVGGVGGLGYTTWGGLVPSEENQSNAMSVSTPIQVREGGGVWGLVAGYEVTPYFAIEANYMAFPKAEVNFDEDSLFAFEQDGITQLRTNTQTGSVMAKVMLLIPKTSMRIYSGAGVASVWRADEVNNAYRISPTFSFGATLNINERVMAEFGTNYTAGYGESEINPAKDYIPFVYSFFAKLVVRFNTFS